MSESRDKSILIEVIKNWEGFSNLKIVWQTLLQQSDADNIFLTWEWIDCWRRTRNRDVKPLIVIIKEKGQVVAIAPFYQQNYRLIGIQTYQALRFLGDQSSGSEYSNFIVKKENSLALKEQLWRYLLNPKVKHDWNFIWFTNIASWTVGGKTLLEALAKVKELHSHARTVEFAQVHLNDLPNDILPVLSKSLRTNIRQTRRRLDKLGHWKIEVINHDSDLQEQLEQLFYLHNKHWQKLGGGTFQRRPELAAFYRSFVPLALGKGWLKLLRLESEGVVQAMQLGYIYNNRFLAIQEGYNPDFLPGVGQVLRHFSYTSCQKSGVMDYDFLGIYTDHKRRWLAEKKLGVNLFIWHNKVKNIPFQLKPIWPTGRYLKPVN